MHITVKNIISVMAATILVGCAQQSEKSVKTASPQEIRKSINLHCMRALPPSVKRDEIAQCMAVKGDTISQMMLANDFLTKNRTAERCKKGLWWLERAASMKDKNAMVALSAVYQGERAAKTGPDIAACTRRGSIKKDPVKAYGYLLAAQNLEENKKAQNPNKPVCKPDYQLRLDSMAAKLTPQQRAAAQMLATRIAPPAPPVPAPQSWNQPAK